MTSNLDTRRILIFLAFAFGIAWAGALAIALTGGLVGSPVLVPGLPYTLAFILTAVVYMGAPAVAHVLTRALTREGWQNVGLRPKLRRGWPFWLAAWFLPVVFTVLGAAVYFLIFPADFDPKLTYVQSLLDQYGTAGVAFTPLTLILIQTVQGVLLSPLLNGLFTFGEEFGWRAYLLPKLMPLGGRRAHVDHGGQYKGQRVGQAGHQDGAANQAAGEGDDQRAGPGDAEGEGQEDEDAAGIEI
ncbi:hypothetical protein FDZ74_11965 [bacterium]|nr:MAG: hypothetical protein FDZ74_11965 [bacterium]